MIYSVKLMPLVEEAIARWRKSNPMLHKKFKKILLELIEHPRSGIGHPEPLKGGSGVTWSRRLSAHDRIIYDIYDDVVTVLVIQVGGHYDDK